MRTSVLSETVIWRDRELEDEPSAARPGSVAKARDFIDREHGVAFRILTSEHAEDFYSPRHRHTFDQVRFMIDGAARYADSHVYRGGDLIFIPGGTWYGPMRLTEEKEGFKHFTMQFRGTSDVPYYGPAEFEEARERLAAKGHFEQGKFVWADDGRKQDGWEAQLQEVLGRPVEYPEPPFETYLAVRSAKVPWSAHPDVAGVRVKPLGHFTATGPRVHLVELAPGAELPARSAAGTLEIACVHRGSVAFSEDPGVEHEPTTFRYVPPGVATGAVAGVQAAEVLLVEWAPDGGQFLPGAPGRTVGAA